MSCLTYHDIVFSDVGRAREAILAMLPAFVHKVRDRICDARATVPDEKGGFALLPVELAAKAHVAGIYAYQLLPSHAATNARKSPSGYRRAVL